MTNPGSDAGQAIAIEQVAEAIGVALPRLDATGRRIAATVYRLLAHGEPLAPAAIAGAAGVPTSTVEEALDSWPGVFRDDDGRVVGFWGLSLAPLDPEYRMRVDGHTVFAWCALDTLFIPALVGRSVKVETRCAGTGQAIALVVSGSDVLTLSPPDTVVSMVIPDGPFGYDVIESFCHRVLFFGSPEAGRRWVDEHPGIALLSVAEAFRVGQELSRRIAPAGLDEIAGPHQGREEIG